MEDIKFTVTNKHLDGSTGSSEATIKPGDEVSFEESETPSPNDPYLLTEQIIINSYEELKPYIVEEDELNVYVDFKGKHVFIQIIADDEHWVRNIDDDNWKYLYIVGQLYLGSVAIEDIVSNMSVDEAGVVFGIEYAVSSILVAIKFSEELASNICIIDRLISCGQDY